VTRGRGASTGSRGGLTRRHRGAIDGRDEEVEPELADAHLGAVVENGAVDALTVDVVPLRER
jgi:hypothetical protein